MLPSDGSSSEAGVKPQIQRSQAQSGRARRTGTEVAERAHPGQDCRQPTRVAWSVSSRLEIAPRGGSKPSVQVIKVSPVIEQIIL